MRVRNLNLVNYQKSLYNTQKIKRTVSLPKRYIQKPNKENAKMAEMFQAYLQKQEEQEKINKLTQEKLNSLIETSRVDEIYYAFLMYGIKLDKGNIRKSLRSSGKKGNL